MAEPLLIDASETARKLADAHMAGGDNLYRFVARAMRDQRRLHALRVHLDCEGKANFSVWANEMIELEGLWSDEDEGIPAMYDTLDELLDALWEVVSTPVEAEESATLDQADGEGARTVNRSVAPTGLREGEPK